MNKICTQTGIVMVAVAIMTLMGCNNEMDYYGAPTSVDPSEYFDFATVYGCPIEISFDRQTLINVYDVDPDQNPEARPIYATFTNAQGQYSGVMQLPTARFGQQLWARGFGFDATARVGKDGVKFDAAYYDPRSRDEDCQVSHILTDEELRAECHRLYDLYLGRLPEGRNNKDRLTETENLAIYTIRDNTEIIFSFVNSGARFTSQLYYFYFPQEVDATEYMKAYVTANTPAGQEPDLSSLNLRSEFMRLFTNEGLKTASAPEDEKRFLLTKGWGVYFTHRQQYITKEHASYNGENLRVVDKGGNLLYGNGFTDAPVTMTDERLKAAKADNIIDKPAGTNWSTWAYRGYGYVNRNFNNQVGAHNQLMFYGRDYDQPASPYFPAGYRIGFILKVQKEKSTGGPDGYNLFTTNNKLNNREDVQCARNLSVSASDIERGVTNIVYGYEDNRIQDVEGSRTEPDYNDFMFLITASPAVSTHGITQVYNEGEMHIDGTLLYEDLYPDAGDYDMNDVMVEYEMWVKFDEDNYVTSIESQFWPINYGAAFDDDMYMELSTDDNKGNVKHYIRPECVMTSGELRSMSAANLQDIMAGKRPSRSVTHKHTFTAADKLHRDSVTIENFNPFIYVHNTNREVHLTNGKFCGVNGASAQGLTPEEQKYYPLMINDNSMLNGCYFPYAMNVPIRFSGVTREGFTPVTESIYIVLEYQRFLDWMKEPRSHKYDDWYRYYQKWGGGKP